ncbi:MAG: ribosome-associated translation inhibitor RaiA [Candidatus Hydrothermota bacterium]|nr:MAG: ribosome-associated translation inhibitor RaiA [Candidatus Hydrothermae bacterium]
MNIRIMSRAKDMPITDGLKQHIEKRFSTFERYSNHIIDGELIFDEERGRFKGELILRVKGTTLTAKSVGKTPLDVIDELKDKMKKQLRRYEEKLKDKGHVTFRA